MKQWKTDLRRNQKYHLHIVIELKDEGLVKGRLEFEENTFCIILFKTVSWLT